MTPDMSRAFMFRTLFTVTQAAGELGVDQQMIRYVIRTRRIKPFTKVGQYKWYHPRDARRILAAFREIEARHTRVVIREALPAMDDGQLGRMVEIVNE